MSLCMFVGIVVCISILQLKLLMKTSAFSVMLLVSNNKKEPANI